MDYQFEHKNGVCVYSLRGNLIGEHDGMALTESFNDQIANGTHNFVMRLDELKHINSSGLGVLITLLTKARKNSGDLVLSSPSPYIRNLLLITKLNTIFPTYDSAEEAMEKYTSD